MGGFSRVVVIAAITFLGLLLCLGLGMFVFRRMLLPRTNVKLPPSGARPWSRTRVPNPDSLGGNNDAESTQTTRNATLAFSAANNGFGPGPNGFEQSTNGYAPASSAFNVGYGLPNDPFASSQGAAPGWPESLGGGGNEDHS